MDLYMGSEGVKKRCALFFTSCNVLSLHKLSLCALATYQPNTKTIGQITTSTLNICELATLLFIVICRYISYLDAHV